MVNVAKLLHEQEILKSRINKMVYGSIEIREQNNKNIFMYIFVIIKNKRRLCAPKVFKYHILN